jgi:raffinose/stachyose/melibiose transport system permease protein
MKSRRPAASRRQYGSTLGIFLFLLPGLGVYTALMLYPAVQSVLYSIIQWQGLQPTTKFGGFGYYRQMLNDPLVLVAIGNNLRAWFLYAFIQLPLAFLLAYALSRKVRFSSVFRFLFFIPNVTTGSILALLWLFVFTQPYGLNAFFNLLGLDSLIRPWLSTDGIVQWTTNLPATWAGVGFWVIIFMAAISGIPEELYEAAQLDGANAWHELIYITFPSMRGIYLTANIAVVNWSLGTYIYQYVMTKGGPLHMSETIVTYTLYQLFEIRNWGYGSTLAVLQFTIGMVLSLLIWRYSRRGRDVAGEVA